MHSTTARRILLEVPMPDGVALTTSVALPHEEGPVPAVLLRSPYPFLSFSESVLGLDLAEVLASGWALVWQDVRGRGGSEGDFGFLGQEGPDGRATLAWMTEQPWCDGRIATVGGSYMGRVQLLIGEAEPGLAGMIPALTGLHSRAAWWPGGVLNLALVSTWLRELLQAEPRTLTSSEAIVVRALYRGGDVRAMLAAALDEQHPASRLMAPLAPLLRGEQDGQLDAPTPRVPTLHVTGWYDQAAAGTIEAWREARRLDERHHLIVGPWSHEAFSGDLHGRRHADGDATAWGLTVQQLDFLRHVLHGEGAAPPPVQHYVTGLDAWRDAETWPPPTTLQTRFLDAPGGLPGAPPAAGELVLHGRAAEPVPTIGGPSSSWAATLGAPHLVGPADATPLTLRDDVLTLRGEPLEHDLELAGRVKLTLTVTTDVAPAGIAAKLAETTPDGALRVLTDGVGTAPGAAGGAPATLHVALSPIHHRVFAGRRLVLLLSASEFPRYALGLDADRTLRIRTGGDAPSRLTLPVVGP